MVQAAAMRGVDDLDVLPLALEPASGEPRIGAAFKAMTVQDIDIELGGELADLTLG